MPVLVTSDGRAITAEMDDAMVKALDLVGNPPPGAHLRMAGPANDGWRIVSLWESRQAFQSFLEARLQPALEAAGRPVPEFTFWDVDTVVELS
jgi:hypothetical protein